MNPLQELPRIEAEVRRIGALQLAGARTLRPADVHLKPEANGEASVVTCYDVESETLLRDFVQSAYPAHSFLGEEQGNELRDPAHYWLLDPIDGTSNFVAGIPYWGTSLAYWRDGANQLGIVHFPALGHTFTAVRGAGAWLDGKPLRTPALRDYDRLACVGLDSRSHLRQALQLRVRVRILGSAIANLCFTASGLFAASSTRAKLWDLAAGEVILREAGAAVETTPDLAGIDPSRYACGDGTSPRIALEARASAELPSLRQYLHAVPPPPPR